MAKTDTVTVAGTDTELDWGDAIPSYQAPEEQFDFDHPYELNTSDWLRDVIRERSIADDFMYGLMVKQPHYIQYAVWDLPVPPSLPEEDHSFIAYIRGSCRRLTYRTTGTRAATTTWRSSAISCGTCSSIRCTIPE